VLVTPLNKRDAFSIVVDPTRNIIVGRVSEAGKAAYSELLDSAEMGKEYDGCAFVVAPCIF
jgi:hypothetical protein